MDTVAFRLRPATAADGAALSAVFDAAWREAYRGLIPGLVLERMLARRGTGSWQALAGRGRRALTVLSVDGAVAGYALHGPARDPALRAKGEVDELYLAPVYQGLGFGTRLLLSVRADLSARGLARVGVWALSDNVRACRFYEQGGGRPVARGVEHASGHRLPTIGYVLA